MVFGPNRYTFAPRINSLSSCQKQLNMLKSEKMNRSTLVGNWKERKGKLRQKFGFLSETDLMFEEGKKEEMLAKLQIKLGKTKEELIKIIAAL